ncbi:glycoside hydrolase family 28 protein [Aquimarina sp. W85]|uniref:glycoside hydrolase family 28 protein n=1 Tax=Aquimarina rhodophyticola TaxID=3342246 RepID=UPI00366C482F
MYQLNKCKVFALGIFSLLLISCIDTNIKKVDQVNDVWHQARIIENSVKAPQFPDFSVNVLDYGAISDSITLNTTAFSKAINYCVSQGGGRVLVPKGVYLTGPIHLDNNINIHLEEGAEIRFSTNPDHYYPLVHTSFEGIELMNYSPLIYAKGKNNIGITGKGVLNGQASVQNWWLWKGSKDYGYQEGMPSQSDSLNLPTLMHMGQTNIALDNRVFGKGHYLRPSFIEPFECTNVLIRDVKIINAPFWIIHPFKSKNVLIDNVYVQSHGPNNDGCDPEYSKNVVIKNSTFNTGDDCIAIKAGRDAEGRRVGISSENILVKNCKMIDGHGGVVIGSEMSAGVKNIFIENCFMDSPNLDRAIRIKTNTRRGGFVDGIYVKNIVIGQVKEAVLKINMHYATHNNQIGEHMPIVKNIYLDSIQVANGGRFVILAKGHESSTIKNINISNVTVQKTETPFSLDHVESIHFKNTYINNKLTTKSL